MATATATKKVRPSAEDLERDRVTADAERECIHAELAHEESRLAQVRARIDPNLRAVSMDAPTDEEVWAAHRDVGTLSQRVAELRLTALAADRRAQATREALRASRLQALLPGKAKALQDVAQALRAARAAVNVLREIEDAEEAVQGGSVHRHSVTWSALASGGSHFTPALDTWMEEVRRSGVQID